VLQTLISLQRLLEVQSLGTDSTVVSSQPYSEYSDTPPQL